MSEAILARDILKNLHHDLYTKWVLHRTEYEHYWSTFPYRIRMQCLQPHITIEDGDVPPETDSLGVEIPHELRLGKLCQVFPGMCLPLLAASPHSLINAIRSRATGSLQHLFVWGPMGYRSDLSHVEDRVAWQREKEGAVADEPDDGYWTLFKNGDEYGRSFRWANLSKVEREVRREVKEADRVGLCVPRSIGDLVLNRQIYILSSLNALVDGILEAAKGEEAVEILKAHAKLIHDQNEAYFAQLAPGAVAMDHKAWREECLEIDHSAAQPLSAPDTMAMEHKARNRCEEYLDIDHSEAQHSPSAPSAIAMEHKTSSEEHLAVDEKKAMPSLSALTAMAKDHRDSLFEHLELLTTEPAVLAHSVNDCYLSRPEFLPDEKGRALPAAPDKYLSWAVFDAMHHAVRSAAIWYYIRWILNQLLSKPDHRGLRPILQQELSNVCHLEYTLCQTAFRAHVQTASGRRSFYRRSASLDELTGRPTTVLKTRPQTLLPANPHLHHVLRLCEPSTTPAQALEHINALTAMHAASPSSRTRLSARESQALLPLAFITTFLTTHPTPAPIPPPSHSTHQTFLNRLSHFTVELNTSVRPAFTLPPSPRTIPPTALQTLSALTTAKTGTTLGALHKDLIDEAIHHVWYRHRHPSRRSPVAGPVAVVPGGARAVAAGAEREAPTVSGGGAFLPHRYPAAAAGGGGYGVHL